MRITAELSLYPLQPDFRTVIKAYIAELQKNSNVTVESNAVSSQLFGEYDDVMGLISQATKVAFEMDGTSVLTCKILNTDRSTSNYHNG